MEENAKVWPMLYAGRGMRVDVRRGEEAAQIPKLHEGITGTALAATLRHAEHQLEDAYCSPEWIPHQDWVGTYLPLLSRIVANDDSQTGTSSNSALPSYPSEE